MPIWFERQWEFYSSLPKLVKVGFRPSRASKGPLCIDSLLEQAVSKALQDFCQMSNSQGCSKLLETPPCPPTAILVPSPVVEIGYSYRRKCPGAKRPACLLLCCGWGRPASWLPAAQGQCGRCWVLQVTPEEDLPCPSSPTSTAHIGKCPCWVWAVLEHGGM